MLGAGGHPLVGSCAGEEPFLCPPRTALAVLQGQIRQSTPDTLTRPPQRAAWTPSSPIVRMNPGSALIHREGKGVAQSLRSTVAAVQ